MFDLHDLNKWVPIGKPAIKFSNDNPREVRLQVNAEDETKLYVLQGRERHFIGRFEGFDVVKFWVPGVFELLALGGPCKVWTPEMETTAVEIPDAISFTRIMTRAARNPELELMMFKMRENMESRILQVENDVVLRLQNERRIEAQTAQREAAERTREAEAKRIADAESSDLDADEDETAETS